VSFVPPWFPYRTATTEVPNSVILCASVVSLSHGDREVPNSVLLCASVPPWFPYRTATGRYQTQWSFVPPCLRGFLIARRQGGTKLSGPLCLRASVVSLSHGDREVPNSVVLCASVPPWFPYRTATGGTKLSVPLCLRASVVSLSHGEWDTEYSPPSP